MNRRTRATLNPKSQRGARAPALDPAAHGRLSLSEKAPDFANVAFRSAKRPPAFATVAFRSAKERRLAERKATLATQLGDESISRLHFWEGYIMTRKWLAMASHTHGTENRVGSKNVDCCRQMKLVSV